MVWVASDVAFRGSMVTDVWVLCEVIFELAVSCEISVVIEIDVRFGMDLFFASALLFAIAVLFAIADFLAITNRPRGELTPRLVLEMPERWLEPDGEAPSVLADATPAPAPPMKSPVARTQTPAAECKRVVMVVSSR